MFDTVSAHSNLALIHYARDYLKEFGIDSRLTFDADGKKANLLAAIGPSMSPAASCSPAIAMSCRWRASPGRTIPSRVVERDNRLSWPRHLRHEELPRHRPGAGAGIPGGAIARPIYLALSYDEEVGCLGVGALLNDLAAAVPRPAAAIIGEPTLMKLINRHKGFHSFTTTVTGRDGHSSGTHRGVNAIAYAAEIVGFLTRLAAEIAAQGPFDDGFDPPYTTINVGAMRGGTATNIIARQCSFDWEFRPIPGFDAPIDTPPPRRLHRRVDPAARCAP